MQEKFKTDNNKESSNKLKKNTFEDIGLFYDSISKKDEEIEKLITENEKILQENLNLLNKINSLENELNIFKKDTLEIFDSHHEIFSLLFLDYELNSKGVFNFIQILSQELLNFIVNICKKYHLNYWLDYGTLLGAMRHNGFIPWDDDIDLGMMRHDVNIFLEIINKELEINNLNEVIQVHRDRINVNGDNIGFIQIFYIPDKVNVLSSLDIFTYDYIKKFDENTQSIFYNEQHLFHSKIKKGISRNQVEKDYFNILNISLEEEDFIIPGIDGYRNEYTYGFDIFEKDMIFPLDNITFNGIEYSCPRNNNKYLESIYGDFKEIPKIIRHHSRVKFLRNKKNINLIFQNEISRLKGINENFMY